MLKYLSVFFRILKNKKLLIKELSYILNIISLKAHWECQAPLKTKSTYRLRKILSSTLSAQLSQLCMNSSHAIPTSSSPSSKKRMHFQSKFGASKTLSNKTSSHRLKMNLMFDSSKSLSGTLIMWNYSTISSSSTSPFLSRFKLSIRPFS